MCVRVGVRTRVWGCMHMCMHVKVDVRRLMDRVSPCDLSLNPELIDFGQTGWPMSYRDPSISVLTSSTGVIEEHLHTWILPTG